MTQDERREELLQQLERRISHYARRRWVRRWIRRLFLTVLGLSVSLVVVGLVLTVLTGFLD